MNLLKRLASLSLKLVGAAATGALWAAMYLGEATLDFIPTLWEALSEAASLFIKVSLAFILGILIVTSGFQFLNNMVDAQKVNENLAPLKISEVAKNDAQIYNPMIRLYRGGRFHCSGTVISDTYAITASHCVLGAGGMMGRDLIEIKDAASKETRTTAYAVGMMKSQDVALLRGNFKQFLKVPMETDSRGWLAHQGPFMSCGFPGGDKAICVPFMPQGNNQFLIYGSGFLYKGMSGGPVLDPRTGQLIAVNSRVNNQGASVGPLIGFLAGMGVEIEE